MFIFPLAVLTAYIFSGAAASGHLPALHRRHHHDGRGLSLNVSASLNISTSSSSSSSVNVSISSSSSSSKGNDTGYRQANETDMNGYTWDWTTQKSHSVNLGGWLVLEEWMDEDFFNSTAPGAIDEWSFTRQLGKTRAKQVLSERWDTWFTKDDIDELPKYGFNMVRIPVPFWAFNEINPLIMNPSNPYVTGQLKYLERLLEWVVDAGMFYVIDLHTMPGCQNAFDNGGRQNVQEWFADENQARSRLLVKVIMQWINGLPKNIRSRIAAYEPVNEPKPQDVDQFTQLKSFYQDTYDIVKSMQPETKIPLVFGDGFAADIATEWKDFMADVPAGDIVWAAHPYYAWDGVYTNQSAILANNKVTAWSGFPHPTWVGEWSLGLDVATAFDQDADWFAQFWTTQTGWYNDLAGYSFWALKNKSTQKGWSLETLFEIIPDAIKNSNA